MANGLKKLISILSASAIAISMVPMALAEDVEVAEATVYYNEDFSSFTSGTIVNMASSADVTLEDMVFHVRRRSGSNNEQYISVSSSGYLDVVIDRHASSDRPSITFLNTESAEFNNSVVMKFKARFTKSDSPIVIADSDGNKVTLTLSDVSLLNTWMEYEIASADGATTVLCYKDGELFDEPMAADGLNNIQKITFGGSGSVGASFDDIYIADEVYELPDEIRLDAAMGQIVINESQMGLTVEDGVYAVDRDISLPSQPTGATLVWTLEQSADGEIWEDTSYASVSDNTLEVEPTEDSENYLVKLTATVTCGEMSDSKSFMFIIKAPDPNAPVVYYNENFSGFADGTVANMSQEYSNNTSYEATNGMTFTSAYRGDGAHDSVRLLINSGKYLEFSVTQNLNDSRKPKIDLSRTRGIDFGKKLVIKADIQVPSTSNAIIFIDSNGNELSLTAPSDEYVAQWLNYTVICSGSSCVILIKNANGDVIAYKKSNIALNDVKQITMNLANVTGMYLDNLYIADENYVISDEDVLAAAMLGLELDGTQANLTANGDEFDAKADFVIPENPEGASVEWTVEQKAVDSDVWEPSSFMSVSGTKVVVNPTSDIENFDVRLVATVTCGTATDTKEFAINLPNPLDEIEGVIASGYEVVESTDYTDATNTTKLTYDLTGEDTLKFDLVLPTKVSGYKNCTIKWTSSNSKYVTINGSTATISTGDLNEHNVTLKAVVTYKKGDITYSSEPQEFPIKVGYTEDDVDDTETYYKGKYKVRFDAAYTGNFNIKSSATSNISLPKKGKFGSTFEWSSSAPSVISNTGVVKRGSDTVNVTLAVNIISGAGLEKKSFKVTVPEKSGGGGGGGGGGGTPVASTQTGTIVENQTAEEIVTQLQEEAAVANDLFKDLSGAAWAREAINGLASAGVVNGKSDTEFAPNDTVTRAEYAKMLMGVFGLNAGAYATSSFKDVSTSAWYFTSVETAYNLGIINGVADGKFDPNALITRQDMAVMVSRAAAVSGVALSEVEEAIAFADEARISNYAKSAVSALQKANIINGVSDTEFAPLENATRAQAAQILYNVFSLIG